VFIDAADTVYSLSPWVLLAAFGLVPLAYWRDSKSQSHQEEKQSRKRTLLLTSGSFASLIIGSVALRALGETGWTVFSLSWFLAVVLAIAGIISGAATRGWTRIAALISGAVILFILMFFMKHCDL
jgi:hypothetical protein